MIGVGVYTCLFDMGVESEWMSEWVEWGGSGIVIHRTDKVPEREKRELSNSFFSLLSPFPFKRFF